LAGGWRWRPARLRRWLAGDLAPGIVLLAATVVALLGERSVRRLLRRIVGHRATPRGRASARCPALGQRRSDDGVLLRHRPGSQTRDYRRRAVPPPCGGRARAGRPRRRRRARSGVPGHHVGRSGRTWLGHSHGHRPGLRRRRPGSRRSPRSLRSEAACAGRRSGGLPAGHPGALVWSYRDMAVPAARSRRLVRDVCVRASTPPLQGWRSPCSPRSAWSPAAT
jgi:hypothetical protein